jgi:hypothetical protein
MSAFLTYPLNGAAVAAQAGMRDLADVPQREPLMSGNAHETLVSRVRRQSSSVA